MKLLGYSKLLWRNGDGTTLQAPPVTVYIRSKWWGHPPIHRYYSLSPTRHSEVNEEKKREKIPEMCHPDIVAVQRSYKTLVDVIEYVGSANLDRSFRQ
jgi:hypothetical protein